MKSVSSVILTLVFFMTAQLAAPAGAFAAVVIDETASTSASAVKNEDYDPNSAVLDDFNDAGVANIWGGNTGSFSDAGEKGSCTPSNEQASPQEGPYCLKLDYNVSASDSFAGYFSKLQSKNIGAYTAISFWVKGAAGGEFFKIELKNNSSDANRKQASVYVNDFMDGGITTAWKQVYIPLHNFANINDWSSMTELVITFENAQNIVNGSPTQGIVYIDKIFFDNTPINSVKIDDFGDKLGNCALGGNIGDMQGDGGSSSHSFAIVAHNQQYSLLSEYNVSLGGWSGQFVLFGGGADGWSALPHDFSGYNYLTLWVRAKSALQNPKNLKIELVDQYGTVGNRIVGITTSWQKWSLSLSADFFGIDKSTIKQINFVYEKNAIDFFGGFAIGGLYIDEVRLEK